MCNFIIRPQKCYTTVNIKTSEGNYDKGQAFFVDSVDAEFVHAYKGESAVGQIVKIPLQVFLHTFSDKKPEEKK